MTKSPNLASEKVKMACRSGCIRKRPQESTRGLLVAANAVLSLRQSIPDACEIQAARGSGKLVHALGARAALLVEPWGDDCASDVGEPEVATLKAMRRSEE